MVLNILFTLVFGVLVTIHVSMNARIGTLAGSAVLANAVFWVVGCVTSLLIALPRFSADKWSAASIAPLARVPPTLFLAGVIGGCLALFNTWMIPRIGIAAFSLLIIFGQLSASALLARTGFLGAMIEPMSLPRLAGLGLVAIGTGLFLYAK